MSALIFSMSIINFICILILYLIVLFLYGKYMDIDEHLNNVMDYQVINDRQIKNLVQDVNYNDKHITQYIDTVMKKK
jgi:hypothetical protein